MSNLRQQIENGGCDDSIRRVYGADFLESAKRRCLDAIDSFEAIYGEMDNMMLISAPGRTEIGGNHTDHQGGHVVAGAVSMDVLAVAAPNGTDTVSFQSQGFPRDVVDLSVSGVQENEKGTSACLIRGVAAAMKQRGMTVGGFCAYSTSQILKGSGLSSSAAFEVLTCNIFSSLFNNGSLSAIDAAVISQYAENVYFGKPSGLMDQMASSVGGFVAINFGDAKNPVVENIPFDFASTGHSLCIVDTKDSHDNLTHEYAAIPVDMRAVAAKMGHELLSQCDPAEFYQNAAEIRSACGDRAFLRASHFFEDDRRAAQQAEALRKGDFEAFLQLVRESGRSSYMYLQNVVKTSDSQHQGLAVGLCMTEHILGNRGAFRVHGGGFAGTIQAFVPNDLLSEYKQKIEALFGEGSCYQLVIRPDGGIRIA